MLCGLAAATLLLPACATITRGTSQKFNVETTPSQADVKLSTGQTCVSPCTLNLKRKSKFKVTVSKEGYKTQEAEVHGKLKGGGAAGFAGNAIFGGVIGAGVDAASGASLNLDPNPLKVTLVPIEQASVAVAAPATAAVPSETPVAPSAEATAPAASAAPVTAATPAADAASSASPSGE